MDLGRPPAYTTPFGAAFCGDSLELLDALPETSIDLVITSPPFALLREKEYGNASQEKYVDWLLLFSKKVLRVLKSTGSYVIDIGGSYRKGIPSRSIHQFRFLVRMCDELGFHLAEEFYWHNPAKLPSPIEWVNKRKIRVKDTVNTVWWFSKTPWPKSDVRKVLVPYSDRMKKLLSDPDAFYNPAKRPSGHDIGKQFAVDNGGAIPSNLLQIPNSESNSQYLACCKSHGIASHPARFPSKLPEFFIDLLTDKSDVVLDIFGGSNTTGYVSETKERQWLMFEERLDYIAASVFRFGGEIGAYNLISSGSTVAIGSLGRGQLPLIE